RLQHFPELELQGRPATGGQQPDPYPEHHLRSPVRGDQVDPGTDRLYQGSSGQSHLRLVRGRAEPSPHWRLVFAAHRLEDGARAFPWRWPRSAGGARRRYPDPVRQFVSDAAAGAGRQAQRACGYNAGTKRIGTGHSDHARERAGAGEVRRVVLVWHFSAEERAGANRRYAQQGDQSFPGARGYQTQHRRDGRAHRLWYATAFLRFCAGGNDEVRRHHRKGRPADGGEVTWLAAEDFIQFKPSSTAATSPIASNVRGW